MDEKALKKALKGKMGDNFMILVVPEEAMEVKEHKELGQAPPAKEHLQAEGDPEAPEVDDDPQMAMQEGMVDPNDKVGLAAKVSQLLKSKMKPKM